MINLVIQYFCLVQAKLSSIFWLLQFEDVFVIESIQHINKMYPKPILSKFLRLCFVLIDTLINEPSVSWIQAAVC